MCFMYHFPPIVAHFSTYFLPLFASVLCHTVFFTVCISVLARPLQLSLGRPRGRLAVCQSAYIGFCISSVSRPLGLLSFASASLFHSLSWGYFYILPPRYGFPLFFCFVIFGMRPLSRSFAVLYRGHTGTPTFLFFL